MALARRVTTVFPLVAAVATAVALTGAAFFTVAHADDCADTGRFVQHTDGSFELVGGCVDGKDLPAVPKLDNVRYAVQP
ncbi:hypothetical protein ABZ816_05420 [Actinosynnema sp. NPDC047251]|uniref:Putative secreted protein n=1 Tax=Saccharothrix espanaensis (strain ATCC 51144 / DSM 44229 / JCM 9112 / NBRC 15066 / NRRL 15764) TaxID=1179773 RepID=K0JVB9_SACES|nr:hypothetical protein [Saccharothrix espanaensis]CCH28108.1 putative secreted protein [Saccharothrix espanaensis DSM 44229]